MSKRPTRIEIDVHGRYDALELSQRLVPYHSHLVERGREHWRVHAQAPGWHGEKLPSALAVIEQCLRERGVDDAAVSVDGEPYRRETQTDARAQPRGD
jgi:hypothetical protein